MTGGEHYREAERLLKSCQLPSFGPGEAGQYPAREDGVDSVGHALDAAQVHATLALAAAMVDDAWSRPQEAPREDITGEQP